MKEPKKRRRSVKKLEAMREVIDKLKSMHLEFFGQKYFFVKTLPDLLRELSTERKGYSVSLRTMLSATAELLEKESKEDVIFIDVIEVIDE